MIRSNLVDVDWSGLTPELLLALQRDGRQPLGSQLQQSLRQAVRTRRLQPGERLPSSRQLARDLGVSRGVVQSAYEQLEAEGYLLAAGGSATRVAATEQSQAVPPTPPAHRARLDVDFAPGRPDLRSFPMRDWLWACGEAGRTASSRDLGYDDGAGSERLRRVVAPYAQRVRAAATKTDQVVICSGFVQGAALTLASLRREGHQVVALENPGHDAIRTLVQRAGLQPVPVPVDDQGLMVSALAATAATVVVLTPAHQTPTGVVLTAVRRRDLLQWAASADAVVIEDDYDSEFRYDKQPVGCLQGLAPDRVVSIASVSKTLAPAVRLGWVLAPPALATAIGQEKFDSDRGSPGLDQIALAHLLESGRFDRHLRRMRGIYRDRRTALTDALSQHAPTARLSGLAAGFHALLHLPASADEDRVVVAAARRSVGVQGLRRYRFPGSTGPAGLVLGFGDLTEAAIRRGIVQIADLLQPEVDCTRES